MMPRKRCGRRRILLPIAAALLVGALASGCWVFDNPIDPANTGNSTASGGTSLSSAAAGSAAGVSFDTTPPVPGGSGAISGRMPGPDSYVLSWTPATDNSTSQSKLEYEVVGGTTPITSLAQAEASPVLVPWTANLTTTTVTFPKWDTLAGTGAHFVDVLVRDLAGNIAGYNIAARKLYLFDIAAEVGDNTGAAAAGTHVFLNDGNANFSVPTNAQGAVFGVATSGYSDLALGNLTGHPVPADGGPPIKDIFVTNNGVSPNEVWQNTGSSAVQVAQTDANWVVGPWSSVALGPISTSGNVDAFVSARSSSTVSVVWDNNGTGLFSSGDPNNGGSLGLSTPAYIARAVLGQLKSTGGQLDIVDAIDGNSSGAPNQVWFNSAGVLSNLTQTSAYGTNSYVSTDAAIADLNGDGINDVFVTNNGGPNTVWANDGLGATSSLTPISEPNFPASDPSTGVALGDLNRDGYTDAFVINNGSPPTVWLNNGAGVFTKVPEPAFAGITDNETGVALGDLNGDGILDAVVSSGGPTGTIRVFLGKGDGTFTEVLEPNIPTGNYVAVAIGRLR